MYDSDSFEITWPRDIKCLAMEFLNKGALYCTMFFNIPNFTGDLLPVQPIFKIFKK